VDSPGGTGGPDPSAEAPPTEVGVPGHPGPLHPDHRVQAPVRPEHTGRWIAGLSAVIVVVAGLLGAGVWLVTRALGPSVPAGFRAVDTPYLTYAVPADWVPVDGEATRILGVTFTGGADGPQYTCRGDVYRRGLATAALVQTGEDPVAVARRFAGELGRSLYTDSARHTPRVTLADPREVHVGGATGAVVQSSATTTADDGCLATAGVVSVLAVPVAGGGTAVLVANTDTGGGPADVPLPAADTVDAIVGSAG